MTTVTTGTGFVLWFTGLPGGGAAELAGSVEAALRERGHRVEVLDEAQGRRHLGQGLGDSRADRDTIHLRLGWLAGKLARHGVAVLVPVAASRGALERVRDAVPNFVEVLVEGPEGAEAGARRVLLALQLRGLTDSEAADEVYTASEEDAVAAHLRELGYLE